MSEPNYIFCPYCAQLLEKYQDGLLSRQLCLGCGWKKYLATPQVGVAIVPSKKGRILLVKRSQQPFKGLWSLPGGYAEYGELPQEAAIREVKEETGYMVTLSSICAWYLSDDHPETYSLVTVITTDEVDEQSFDKTDTLEISEIGWFDCSSLPTLAFTSHFDALKKWALEPRKKCL